ncbi:MAG: penicillin-binding protein 2 [Patescibacteria group bacterium]|nr:penicillin-binding protein 2 [Patescibacteria group bacterium]
MSLKDLPDYLSRDDVWQSKEKNRPYLKWIFLFLGLAFLLLLYRAWQLQIIQGAYYKDLASGNRLRRIFVLAPRGAILDKNDKELAFNQSSYAVVVSPVDLSRDPQEREKVYQAVSVDLNLDIKGDVEKALEQGSEDELNFAIDITQPQALILKEKWSKLTGVSVEDRFRRNYVADLSHILGYVGKIQAEEWAGLKDKGYLMFESLGKTGLEAYYQDLLRGEMGAKEVEVDAFGKIKKVLATREPKSGNNLKLTLNYALQQKAKEILARRLKDNDKIKGSLVALDPKTGGILAMVSLPDYDNRLFVNPGNSDQLADILMSPDQPMFNRAISGAYPSGSTIKPLIATAGLQEGVIGEYTTVVDDKGYLEIPNQYDPEIVYRFNDNKIHGNVDVRSAIAQSCNVFFYTVGGGFGEIKGLGANLLNDYMKMFGLGAQSGIDLPGEAAGLIPTPEWKQKNQNEPWYLGDTYNLSIGQGNLLTTPLQIARYTMVIANNGNLYQPHFLNQILDENGKVIKNFTPVNSKLKIDENNLRIVREAMREAVLSGSGNQLQSLKISSAAKTGTAEDATHPEDPHSWFTSFAPYEDPGIVVTVMAENAGEGYDVAEPVAKELLEWWQDNR